jgi:hypothetical protein
MSHFEEYETGMIVAVNSRNDACLRPGLRGSKTTERHDNRLGITSVTWLHRVPHDASLV